MTNLTSLQTTVTSDWGESGHNWQGWRNESGSLFQRRGDAYLNERSVIFNEEMFGGRERVTTDEEQVLRGVEQRSDYGKHIFMLYRNLVICCLLWQ